MARRSSDDDKDSGLWWKLGAAALGAAAIGGVIYGAVKLAEELEEEKKKPVKIGEYRARPAPPQPQYALFDSHSSIPRSESGLMHQNQMMRSHSPDECPGEYRARPAPPEPQYALPDSSIPRSESCLMQQNQMRSHSPDEYPVLDGSLRQRLEKYYVEHVEIPEMEMEKAQAAVDHIKNEYLEHIREKLSQFNIKMVDSGSTAEGLKVIDPHEFDVMLVVESQNMLGCEIQHGNTQIPDASGYYLITFNDVQLQSRQIRSSWPDLPKWKENGYLSPELARRAFKSLSDQIFIGFDSYNVSSQVLGPAVTVRVQYKYNPSQFIFIDFVPAFQFGSEIFVAKPHPKVEQTNGMCSDVYKYLWRKSYSGHEKKLVKKIEGTGCHLKCLKILKAVKVHHPSEMNMFSSYVLKTIMFQMYQDENCWPDEELHERFVQMLIKLKAYLEKRKLRSYFQTDINLLEYMTVKQCDHAVNYLRRIIDKQRWDKLLSTDVE